MRKITFALMLLVIFITLFSFDSGTNAPSLNKAQFLQDSLEIDRTKYLRLVAESIKGKENMRADSVFKNIKNLKIPAGRLLKVMELGYSKSLGVSCGHCHNTDDFASEEKKQKEITRQMSTMTQKINGEMLKNIPNLKSTPPMINCTTCHRGEVKPALNLPVAR